MFRHMHVHCVTPVIVQVTSSVGAAMVVVANLGFTGLGASPPSPELGAMISSGFQYMG
ncbi:MAG TPA: hypothetical protein VFL91_26555 [Thermomicrobiales bacterium]|nr:hypothetical protein [Thermomicrobiales bacterium]